MEKWFVYILKCEDESLYTGITTDVEKRFSKQLRDFSESEKSNTLFLSSIHLSSSIILRISSGFY